MATGQRARTWNYSLNITSVDPPIGSSLTTCDLAAQQPTPALADNAKLSELTQREREVLELLARGLSNREIADALVVEESTIRTHVKRILVKLDLRDRVQAVIFAYETGINRPSPQLIGRHRELEPRLAPRS